MNKESDFIVSKDMVFECFAICRSNFLSFKSISANEFFPPTNIIIYNALDRKTSFNQPLRRLERSYRLVEH